MNDKWYIMVDGVKVSVTEEVYRAYMQPVWREAKRVEVRADREESYEYMVQHDADDRIVQYEKLVEDIVESAIFGRQTT